MQQVVRLLEHLLKVKVTVLRVSQDTFASMALSHQNLVARGNTQILGSQYARHAWPVGIVTVRPQPKQIWMPPNCVQPVCTVRQDCQMSVKQLIAERHTIAQKVSHLHVIYTCNMFYLQLQRMINIRPLLVLWTPCQVDGCHKPKDWIVPWWTTKFQKS